MDTDPPSLPADHAMRRAVDDALARSEGAVVVVRGPIGAGKTRLLRSVQRSLAVSGRTPRLVTASPSSPTPYGALGDLLAGLDVGQRAPAALACALTERLEASGGPTGQGPVLIVDDVAHLDDASAAVVQQVGLLRADGGGGRVSLLFSIREGHTLPAAIAALLAAHDHVDVHVAPLTTDDVATLAATLLGGPLDDTSLQALVAASRGNPLYIRELLAGVRDAGTIVGERGVWRFTGRLALSPLLEELIVARLGPLADDERRAVELIAIGGPLELRLVDHLMGSTDETTPDSHAVETLENRGVVVINEDDRVDLIHPLYGEVVRAAIGRLTRQRRFAELARAELAVDGCEPTSPTERLRSTLWHVRGGLKPSSESLLTAANLAMQAFDPVLAAELAMQAYADGRNGRAALLAAWGYATTGRHDEAATILRGAIDTADDEWVRTACRLRLAEELWWWGHDLDGARELLTIADAPAGTDQHGSIEDILSAQHGVFAVLDGDIETAHERCAPLVDHPSILVRFVAAIGLTHALAANDRADEALALAQRTYDECVTTDEELLGDANIHVVNQIMALINVGRLDDARWLGDMIHDVATQQPALISKAWGSLMSGFALVLTGEPARARLRLVQAEAYWNEAGVPGIQRWALAGRVLAESALGAPPEPAEIVAAFDELHPDGFGLYGYLAELSIVWCALGHDDERLAQVHAHRAIAAATAPAQRAHVAHDLARLGLVDPVATLARPSVTGPLSGARWDFVDGVLHDDAELLERSADNFGAAGAHLFAAEGLALAARLHRRAGRRRETARLDGRLARELQLCGAVDTAPLRTRTVRRSDGALSTRERQIVRLAATGITNRAIAEQLIIGERTVETHLAHAYLKLGIAGRSELGGIDIDLT